MRSTSIIAMLVILAASAARAADSENLAKDASFEEPGESDKVLLNWDFYTSKDRNIALTNNPVHSGNSSVHLWTQGRADAHLGVSQSMDVLPKARYTFRAFVMNDKENKLGGSVVGNLGIEWLDAEGAEISRATSKEWTSHLSKMRWEEFEVVDKAPPFASRVKFVIYLRDGDRGGEGGLYLDDASVTVKQK